MSEPKVNLGWVKIGPKEWKCAVGRIYHHGPCKLKGGPPRSESFGGRALKLPPRLYRDTPVVLELFDGRRRVYSTTKEARVMAEILTRPAGAS